LPVTSVVSIRLCNIILCYFSHTLLMLPAMFRTWMGHYIWILTSRVSVFKLGRVFVLFQQLTQ